jgi:quercetin dioxygenase-like cupin family protein
MTPDDHRPTARAGPQAARLGGRMRSAVTLCTRGRRWAAVAVAAPVLALAAGLMAAGPARATPPAGITTEILGSGTTLGGFKIHVDGIKVESKGAASFTVAHLTFAPGGTTGWHVHPGPVLVTVISGSVTKFSADCTAQTYTAGQAFVENGPADENMVRNDGSVDTQTIVTFLNPPGAPIREDAPPPPGCNP